MNQTESPSREEAVAANIAVHSAVSHWYNESPHFRPENQEKVKNILKKLRGQITTGSEKTKLLDMGCGTGFILNLAHDIFDQLEGVDVTEAMISQVDLSPGNINTQISKAEETPFEDQNFDFVTAYSFIDHLADLKPFMKEVHRVLKPGGIFYSDLNPNRAYWNYLFDVDSKGEEVSPIIAREIKHVVHNDDILVEQTGLDAKTVADCEAIKQSGLGFDPAEFTAMTKEMGFSQCTIEFDWYMGQGNVLKTGSAEDAEVIDKHLRELFPASQFLFKYLRFIVQK